MFFTISAEPKKGLDLICFSLKAHGFYVHHTKLDLCRRIFPKGLGLFGETNLICHEKKRSRASFECCHHQNSHFVEEFKVLKSPFLQGHTIKIAAVLIELLLRKRPSEVVISYNNKNLRHSQKKRHF